MTKIYITSRSEGVPDVLLLQTYFGTKDRGNALFISDLPADFAYSGFTFVDNPTDADYFLFPHGISTKQSPLLEAVEKAREEAGAAGKVLLVFVGGDLSHDNFIDGVVVLKGSQYTYLKRDNEIIVPPSVEDLGARAIRAKSARPVVSFCGWAGFPTRLAYAKYVIRNVLIELEALVRGRHLIVHKKGLYWRRRAMNALSHGARVETHFIVRSSFSGNVKTISMDPVQAREEYVANLENTDFVLAPKGDANFSLRFYEATSMGRLPILIDTETALPLSEVIDYDAFIVRIPYTEVDAVAHRLVERYEALTDESFAAMQHAARAAYADFLRYDRFFSYLFTSEILRTAATNVLEAQRKAQS